MNAEWWKQVGSDRAGYYGHSSVCGCPPCLVTYERHQTAWQECICLPCLNHNIARNDPFTTDEKGQPNMASVNFCDRCESMGKSNAMGSITFRTDPSKRDETKELCPGCVGDFMEWMNSDIMTTRERGYKTPWSDDKPDESVIMAKREARQMLRELLAGDDNDAA